MTARTPPSARRTGNAKVLNHGRSWLSIPYVLVSVIVPSSFAVQQMSYLRSSGPDLHLLGSLICGIGAIAGIIAAIRMIRSKNKDRNYRTATVATIAGALIFILGAVVIASTDSESAPRVGGLQDAASG